MPQKTHDSSRWWSTCLGFDLCYQTQESQIILGYTWPLSNYRLLDFSVKSIAKLAKL